ncbi:hypothetical protein [Rhizobium sp. PL01]|jgi:hypothetical protein|uniref:hypothetical protein n=1 Tax=Rhizobium sp. PL01 TaxID=3085631 RepID=UPI0029821B75|nr:hypothetical protein [Rhizobium sp. PL01]MDW5316407.1 hypothetical protein [Rhizobium sp. PL01]
MKVPRQFGSMLEALANLDDRLDFSRRPVNELTQFKFAAQITFLQTPILPAFT